MSLVLGSEIDFELTSKRLKDDITDDWFRDPFDFDDFLDDLTHLERIAGKRISTSKAISSLLFDIPKKKFILRYSVETFIVDRILYQAIIDKLVVDFDRAIRSDVYNHRHRTADKTKLFKKGVEAWNDFQTAVTSDLKARPDGCLLVTDLANYYENISLDDLKSQMLYMVDRMSIPHIKNIEYKKLIFTLHKLLNKWSHFKGRSIPQNRDASSFLGNIYMSSIDNTIGPKYRYYRYMDDIRIVCDSEVEARQALADLIRELRKFGLSVNSAKTHFISDASKIELKNEFLSTFDNDTTLVEHLISKRTLTAYTDAAVFIIRKVSELTASQNIGERKFRFYINRLNSLVNTEVIGEIISARSDFQSLLTDVIAEVGNQPWAIDEVVKLLRHSPLQVTHLDAIENMLLMNSKYEWVSYHLWMLLVAKDIKTDNLIREAKRIINQDDCSSPEVAGALVYIGKFAPDDVKWSIVDNFRRYKYFLAQRHALIAIHDLKFDRDRFMTIKKHINQNLDSSYGILNKKFSGKYCKEYPLHSLATPIQDTLTVSS